MLRTIWYLTLLAFVLADKGRDGKDGTVDKDEETSGSNIPPSSTSSTASTTSSMPPAVTPPVPSIRFSMPSNATTCTPLVFQWQVVPPSSNITQMNVRLLVSNDGVVQALSDDAVPPYVSSDASPTRRQLPPQVISHEITNGTSLSAGEFNWTAVDVPEGWYVLQASPADAYPSDLATRSERFFVMAGSNTTCVHSNVPTPPISSPPIASTVPVRKGLSAGALAGTIVGAVVGLSVLIAAFVLPRLWRRGVPEHQAWKGKTGGLYHVF